MEIRSSASALRNLSNARKELEGSFKKLSSGLRITSAKDDAAGLAIAEALISESKQLTQGVRNANDGISVVQIAEGTLSGVSSSVSRLQELATQAANGTLNDSQRATINQEFQAIKQEIDRSLSTTEFNGQNVFGSEISLQVGTDSGTDSQIQLNTSSTGSISGGLESLDISSAEGARSALTALTQVSATVSQTTGNLGAIQSRLETAINNNLIAAENITAASSRIRDLDIAAEVAKKVSFEIREKSSVAVLAYGKLEANQVKKLLG
jgi:flagellin